ncbi:MAG: 5,6-dimethylbenzimidazole synthase [Hyphomicrobiales bacterium]|nr:5,6-dimethylbenzimidazole synthase [Hyphomicrobiales bacterium]
MRAELQRSGNIAPDFDPSFRAKLHELFRWRRDVRHFRRSPLPSGALQRLLDAACLAPSVGLSQPWRFVIVDDDVRRVAIRECFEACNAQALREQKAEKAGLYASLKLAGLVDAPTQVAVFTDRATTHGHGLGRHTMPEMIEYSGVIAIHTLWLAGRAEGIGVGWVSILDPSRVASILDTPPAWKLIGYLCIGYPEEECETPELERRGWEERRSPSAIIVRR